MTKTFREMPGFTTTDGHRYTSIPTRDIPHVWHRWIDENRVIHYSSGDYLIRREPYTGKRVTYQLSRDVNGKLVSLGIGGFGLLRDAQTEARRNARGQSVVNWA